MIRTLIVDDSPTSRILMRALIESDPGMMVAGEAASASQALSMARELAPDLITMDLQMSGMNGFDASEEIMANCPTPIVIVTAGTRLSEVDLAMEALRVGALAAIHSPFIHGKAGDEEAKKVLNLLKAMADVKVLTCRNRNRSPRQGGSPDSAPVTPVVRTPIRSAEGLDLAVVGIAASTGGPNTVATLLNLLPKDFPAPILLVQHISNGFVNGFANWLDSRVDLKVKVASQEEALRAGTVYVGPDETHFGVSRYGRVVLSGGAPIRGFKPSASFLFSSIAKGYGSACSAVVLTGMGDDGVDGLADVQAAGGHIFAQDEESCVVYGMPKAAIDLGFTRKGHSLADIGAKLRTLCSRKPTDNGLPR